MEQPFGTFRHDYSGEQWAPIEKQLSEYCSVTDLDRLQLQNAAAQYKFDLNLLDPNSEEFKRAAADSREFLAHARRQLPILDRLHRQRPLLLAFDAKDDPYLRDGWSGLKALLTVYMEVAEAETSTDPRFQKSTNHARSKALDVYLAFLLDFWIGRGGHPGKSDNSPAARFILAAAQPVIPGLKARTVSNFIRCGSYAGRPAIGRSK